MIDEVVRLPGEAQKIDRILQAFASKYHSENPAEFSSADTVYVLALLIDTSYSGVSHSSSKTV